MSTAGSMLEKYRGCLIGSHVGDCTGAPFELRPRVQKSVLKRHLHECWKGRECTFDSKASGHYTDDTAMTLCLAKSLIENQGFNAQDVAKRFVDEYYSDPMTEKRLYGSHVVRVFRLLRESNYTDVFGPAKSQFGGAGSYGNGAAMRTAPVALHGYNEEEEMLKVAVEASKITHTHQDGYNGAVLQCLAIQQALRTPSDTVINPVDFITSLLQRMEQLEKPIPNAQSEEEKQTYCNSLRKMKKVFQDNVYLTPEEVANQFGNEEIGPRSQPTAIYSFLKSLQPFPDFERANPFVRAMYLAISIAGDTDTIAAMTGALSGAYHGESVIPKGFVERCEAIEESRSAADKLYALFCAK